MAIERNALDDITPETLCARLADVTDGGAAWGMIEGPYYTGLVVVTSSGLQLPGATDPSLEFVEDVRLFGEKGEWHFWVGPAGGWCGRFCRAVRNGLDVIEEAQVVWGSRAVPASGADWTVLAEDRGIRVPVPKDLADEQLPLVLEVGHIVDRDRKSGLAGIVDAVLLRLLDCHGAVLLPPGAGPASERLG